MNVAVISNQNIFKWGVERLLELLGEQQAQFRHFNFQASKRADVFQADLIIADLLDNVEAALESLNKITTLPQTSCVGFINTPASIKFTEVKKLGLNGLISHTADTKLTLSALNLVINGGQYLPLEYFCRFPSCMEQEVDTGLPKAHLLHLFPGLSARQADALCLLGQGLSNKTIADKLNISVATVKAHLHASFRVLNVKSRAEAITKIGASNQTLQHRMDIKKPNAVYKKVEEFV